MRQEELQRIEPVVIVFQKKETIPACNAAGIDTKVLMQIEVMPVIDIDSKKAEQQAKQQFLLAQRKIIDFQKSKCQYTKADCWIIYLGNVYQVYASNSEVKKITGGTAKMIKKLVDNERQQLTKNLALAIAA